MLINLKKIYKEISEYRDLIAKKSSQIPQFIHSCDENGDTLLHYAILEEDIELVKLFSKYMHVHL